MATTDDLEFSPTVGEALRNARVQAQLEDVRAFLDRLKERGVPLARSVVYDVEAGRRRPTEHTIRNYAKGLDRDDLLELVDRIDGGTSPAPSPDELSGASLMQGLVSAGDRDVTHISAVLSADRLADIETLATDDRLVAPQATAVRGDLQSLARAMVAKAIVDRLAGKIPKGAEIHLSQSGTTSSFPGDVTDEAWHHLLQDALRVGLDLQHVRAVRSEPEERARFAHDLKTLIGFYGRYMPRAMGPNDQAAIPHKILAVPGVGSMQFLATRSSVSVDSATFDPYKGGAISDESIREAASRRERYLWRHIRLQADEAKPMVTRIDAYGSWEPRAASGGGVDDTRQTGGDADHWWSRLRGERSLAEFEGGDGDRYMFKDGLGTVLCPNTLVRQRVNRAIEEADSGPSRPKISDQLGDAYVEVRAERYRRFAERLGSYRGFDFVTERSIASYCDNGRFSDYVDDYWGQAAQPEERIDHLRFVIDFLDDHPSYHLFLLTDQQLAELVRAENLSGAGWLVKDTKSARRPIVCEAVKEIQDLDSPNGHANKVKYTHTFCEIDHHTAHSAILQDMKRIARVLGADLDAQRRETKDKLQRAIDSVIPH